MQLQISNTSGRLACIFVIMAFSLITTAFKSHAQNLEPRAYSNAPVGMNFLIVGYDYADGALLFDPSLPVTDASARVDMGFAGYVRSLDVADKSAKVGVLLPYAVLDADGYVEGVYTTREDSGMADPAFYFTINLYGGPALSFEEFKDYRQETIVGLSLKITAPLGVYDADKLLNIGTNRWSFKPEAGISRAIGRWTLEAALAATFYTDNDEFDNDKTRQQDPIYSAQGHIIYTFPAHIWASIGANYYAGGRTTIEGISKDDVLENWRTGFTLAFPVSRHHSIKVFGNSGVSTRTGTDYNALGIAWQYRWGGGL
jgi:hypothetical protein